MLIRTGRTAHNSDEVRLRINSEQIKTKTPHNGNFDWRAGGEVNETTDDAGVRAQEVASLKARHWDLHAVLECMIRDQSSVATAT
ncbi:hypothetical protein MRB53_037356 [Persea americana]|nr:hypothetical protein MRB53_037356 [Persea americana]